MSNGNAEFHFENKTDLLKYFQTEIPEAYSEYVAVKETIKKSGFSGSIKLLRRENDEKVAGFQAFLTELNFANLLLVNGVRDVKNEPCDGVDFSFENNIVSIKNLQVKDYEKVEDEEIKKMIEAGGGKKILSHKDFSEVELEVEKNEMGTYTQSRTETGHSGVLGSDISQMSPALRYIGEYEAQANPTNSKKILFILNYSQEFKPYHAQDIGLWYLGVRPKGYRFLFENNMSWYLKLLVKEKKENNIDALIFMFPPRPLIWPQSCFAEVSGGWPRFSAYCKDKELKERLRVIFSS